MRTIIELPAEQIEALDAVCKREGISRAEAIRRAVAIYNREQVADPGPAFGIWRGRWGVADGVAYQRRARREWDA
jgi:hypothetical protein